MASDSRVVVYLPDGRPPAIEAAVLAHLTRQGHGMAAVVRDPSPDGWASAVEMVHTDRADLIVMWTRADIRYPLIEVVDEQA